MRKLFLLFLIGNVVNIFVGLGMSIFTTILLIRTLYFSLIFFIVDMVGIIVVALGVIGFLVHRFVFNLLCMITEY
jgi:hypothetical protein